jgi:predicted AlkP superfamily phosphohydrolase/phosphomutase
MNKNTPDMKVVVVGIDGATWRLIKPWVNEGKLPTFKKLMGKGAWGILESLEVPISSASWVTITTGKNPGKHNIFDFSTRKENSYDIRPVSSKDIKSKQIWDILGDHGKKVAVLNVPMTYPPKKVNGVMISGFPCPEVMNNFTYPKNLINELRREISKDIHFQPKTAPHNEEEFLEEMLQITEYVKLTTLYLLGKEHFDFIMTVFVGPDAVGHTFFKYIDKNHPKHEPNEKLSKSIFKVYAKIDRAIDSIIKELSNNAKVFLVSDHGFSSVYYSVALNKWLMEKGYLKLKNSPITLFRRFLFNLGLTYENLFKFAIKLNLVKKAQDEAYSEKSLMRKLLELVMITWNDIDWSNTKAYSQGNFGQIFINLKGREPKGSVDQIEYDDLVDEIIEDLKKFKHDGEQIFDVILRGKDVYKGKYANKGSDVICLNSTSKYVVSRFFEFGSKKVITTHPVWSGTHDRWGIFLAWDDGEDIKHIDGNLQVTVKDITPTILYMFDIPIPVDSDGKVLREIFRDGSKFARQNIKYEDIKLKMVIERLKNEVKL